MYTDVFLVEAAKTFNAGITSLTDTVGLFLESSVSSMLRLKDLGSSQLHEAVIKGHGGYFIGKGDCMSYAHLFSLPPSYFLINRFCCG